MKIAISVKENTMSTLLDRRFGRCPYFYIINTSSEEGVFIENEGLTSNQGAGIQAATQIIQENVDVVITGALGPNAFRVLEKSGIKAYESDEIGIKETIEKYNSEALNLIVTSGSAHQGMAR